MNDDPRIRPIAALGHPLWWLALSVLLVNDHLLKGSGLLPDLVTGKLSDIAGLVVLPPLLAVLVRARSERVLRWCFAAVGLGFVAVNLLPPVARLAELSMSWAGWRLWPDPTDLMALPALAIAWHVLVPMTRSTPRQAFLVAKMGVVLGAFACMATSSPTVPCGDRICSGSEVCCNESCGICTPPGGSCIELACDRPVPSGGSGSSGAPEPGGAPRVGVEGVSLGSRQPRALADGGGIPWSGPRTPRPVLVGPTGPAHR